MKLKRQELLPLIEIFCKYGEKMSIRRLNTQQPDFAAKFSELVAVDSSVDPEITRRAEAIVQDVRARGDEAVLEYTNRFDHMDAKSVAEFRLTEEDLKEALETLPKDQKDALTQAAQRIREFHEHELGQSWSITEEDGTKLGIRYIPLDSVGLYVPGGKAAYPSSVLMNAMARSRCRLQKDRDGCPDAGRQTQSARSCCCLLGRRQRVLHHRRCSSHCRFGLRHGKLFLQSTRSSGRATPTWPPLSAMSSVRSALT